MATGRRVICPECGADNAASNKFCEACGVMLVDAEPKPESPGRAGATRSAPSRDRAERVAVNRQVASARRTVAGVRLAYVLMTIISALVTLRAAMEAGDLGWNGDAVLIVAITGGFTLFLIAGTLLLYVHPFIWTLALACVYTLLVTLSLAIGAGVSALDVVLLFFLWSSVPLTLKVTRLMREHPELVDAKRLKRREKRAGVAKAAARERATERAVRERRAKLRFTGMIVGVVLAIGLGAWGIRALAAGSDEPNEDATPTLSDAEVRRINRRLPARIMDFRTEWSRSGLEAIEASFTDERRTSYWPKVERLIERRGWRESLPTIGEPSFTQRSRLEQNVHFPIEPKGTLKTHWVWMDDRWRIHSMRFADTR